MNAFVSRRALVSSVSLAAMSAGLGACGISGGRGADLPVRLPRPSRASKNLLSSKSSSP